MRTALVIGGRPDYAGPAVRILPRTGARVYLSERWKVDDLINNNDRQQQQLISLRTMAETNMPGSATQVVFALLHPFLTKDSKSIKFSLILYMFIHDDGIVSNP